MVTFNSVLHTGIDHYFFNRSPSRLFEPLLSEVQKEQPQAHQGSPETKAGLLSSLTFSWLTPLLKAGYKGALQKDQVPELPLSDQVDHIGLDFER